MTSRFIFSIWSDLERWGTHTHDDLLRTFKDEGKLGSGVTGQALIRKLNGLVYCYDNWTQELASGLGLDTIRMPTDVYATEPGHYCRKLLSMQHALKIYDDVCHLDLDMVLVRPLPNSYWQQMEYGATLQAPLMRHVKKTAVWRADVDSQRYRVNACHMYCDSPKLANRCVAVMHENPTWFEEIVIGYVIDEIDGGWCGPDSYDENGHQPPGIWQLRGCFNSDNPWFVHNNRK